jgi:pyruvate dehydrogenase E2 component (dihydrolipoamide acetyltransferase)
MYGIQQFRAIINPPEGAILAVGSVVRKPVVIDGITAAQFLNYLSRVIEEPDFLQY